MSEKVFVSPGIYTSEKDITFITRQVGVTSLGLVGETTIGPAFQPIFINNYGEFKSFFGGLNNTLVKDTGAPLYELPYVAKSYLSQSNQLFVTRVLGFSGFDAGYAWGITLDGALDPATKVVTVSAVTSNPLISYTATTGGSITNLISSTPLGQQLINDGSLKSQLSSLGYMSVASTLSVTEKFLKTGSNFSGLTMQLTVTAKGTSGGFVTGTTSGTTTYYSGTSFSDVENKIVAVLRSRGKVDFTSQTKLFDVTGTTGVAFDPTIIGAATNPLGDFSLSGVSNVQGLPFNYSVSLDKTKRNYLPKVLGRTVQDGKTSIFVEEFYGNMFANLNSVDKVRGIKLTMVNYEREYYNYLAEFSPAETPYVVSELRGNKVLRLFKFVTISDGNAANEQFKISILNIKPDTKEFDVIVRGFYDTDTQPTILEAYSRCTMDPTSANFIGRKIGTLNGIYVSKSSYVLVDIDDTSDTSDAFPAGFVGYPIRDYKANGNSTVKDPNLSYKTAYTAFENKRKSYLGLSNTVGIDADIFDYKGKPDSSTLDMWTGLTNGFHMDIEASGVTIENVEISINSSGGTYNPIFTFDTGEAEFKTEADLYNGPYEKVYSRKFTFAPYGGFDGWDVYRTRKSNTDQFLINGLKGVAGLNSGTFANRTLTNGDRGINSDYYAFLEAIWTLSNPEAINVNVIATPGIDIFDNSNLVEETIDMIETKRADSLYIVTTPDTNPEGDILSAEEVVDTLGDQFDSSYTATYWPWIQIEDAENNVLIFVPPTRDVVRNIGLTDNIAFPWFTIAGVQRGDVDAIQCRKKLTQTERDTLYENRINPIATFTSEGIKIWGNKTLQVKDSALNRISVRRLLLRARKLISAVSVRLLFEQNDTIVRNQFLSLVNPILDNIRSERGLYDFRVELSNNPEDFDRSQLVGKIYLKPTRALEYIILEFNIMNTGASFDNI